MENNFGRKQGNLKNNTSSPVFIQGRSTEMFIIPSYIAKEKVGTYLLFHLYFF